MNNLLLTHSPIFSPKVSAEPGLFFAAGKRKQQSEAMMDYTKMGDQIVWTAQAAVGEKLDTLESKVDDAIESTVHELRNETQKTADQVLTRWIDYCEKQIPKIEAYITSHPWQFIVSLGQT